jgi:hypothetical protein
MHLGGGLDVPRFAGFCQAAGMNSTARTVLIVILILILLGALPVWPYSAGWGIYPAGGLGLVVLILVILLLLGKL